MPISFNRKEKKDHGEGGKTLGAPLKGEILIVDDVISAGTSVNESHTLIKANQASLVGVVIALDRQERGHRMLSAVQEVEAAHDAQVLSIINLGDIVEYISNLDGFSEQIAAIKKYSSEYGTTT